MKSNKDYINEDSVHKIMDLLNNKEIDELLKSEQVETEDIIEGDYIPELVENSYPGYMNVKMLPTKMALYLELKAPVNSDNEITIADIKSKIEAFGSYCESVVDWEQIRDVYTSVMFDGEIVSDILIAKGKEPKLNIPEHIIIKEGLIPDSRPEIIDGDRVNFHHIHSFVMIQKGEFIGDIIPELPGVNGTNLLGKEIKAPKKIINLYKPGGNTTVSSGRLYSNIEGSLKIVDDTILVDPVLQISTDIDYTTGDISFSGDIEILKSIREGFSVTSKRDILVHESIEPSNVTCDNDIIVKHGIYGSEKYEINCKHNIDALHIANARIKALGTVSITNGVVNSSISTIDKIIVGDKGAIVGGHYHSQNGVISGNIGNHMGIETYIYTGTDYTIENKLKSLQDTSISLIEEMNKLQDAIQISKTREERDKLKYLFLMIKGRLTSLKNFSRSLLSRLDKNDKSEVIVLGTVYPGTYIEICHMSYIVDKELSRVKFSLDKMNGCIKKDFL